MTTPTGFDRVAIEKWVRRRTRKKISLENYAFCSFEGEAGQGEQQERRDDFMKFARALQRELLHSENWDGTVRS